MLTETLLKTQNKQSGSEAHERSEVSHVLANKDGLPRRWVNIGIKRPQERRKSKERMTINSYNQYNIVHEGESLGWG